MKNCFASSLLLIVLASTTSLAQNFVMRESNLDPKKNSYYFEIARKCELALQNKETFGSLPFSNNSNVTNTTLHYLSEQFMIRMADMKDSKDYGMALDRPFKNDKEKIIKYTYGVMPPDKNQTMKYTQLIVKFDKASPSPKIQDVQIKSQSELGFFTLSAPEIAKLRKKPAPAQTVVQKSKPVVEQKEPVVQASKVTVQQKKPTAQTSNPTVQQKKPLTQKSKPTVQQKKPAAQKKQ